MSAWYWVALLLANIPLCLLVGRLVFGTCGDFLAVLWNSIGLSARVWTMEDAEQEESRIIDSFKASLVILFTLAAALAEHWLFKQISWI